jgi:arsenate reductase
MIEYLKTPPSRDELLDLLQRMDIRPRDLLRRKGTPYDELGLDDPKCADDQLIDLMFEHPILINRPIVVTELGVKLCRPWEMCSRSSQSSRRIHSSIFNEDGTPVT